MSTHPTHPNFQTGHIGLNVSDLNRSKEFYQQVFGFQVLMESQKIGRQFVFMGEGERTVLTLWQQSEGKFAKDRPGLHHLSFHVDTIEAVQQVEQQLRAMNVRLFYEGIVPHAEGMQSGGIYFEDPDGLRLEVFSPSGAGEYTVPSDGPSCGLF